MEKKFKLHIEIEPRKMFPRSMVKQKPKAQSNKKVYSRKKKPHLCDEAEWF